MLGKEPIVRVVSQLGSSATQINKLVATLKTEKIILISVLLKNKKNKKLQKKEEKYGCDHLCKSQEQPHTVSSPQI